MPNNTRGWARRKIDMSKGNLETGIIHLLEVLQIYMEPHPEIATPIDEVMTVMQTLQETLDHIKELI